jgi:hypothetical protein
MIELASMDCFSNLLLGGGAAGLEGRDMISQETPSPVNEALHSINRSLIYLCLNQRLLITIS